MNSISVSGNLGKDSEMRHLANGDAICSFSVADSMGKDKATIWWNCSLFGKRAEALSPYLMKGQQVTVIGNVTEREWTDKEGGKRKSMDVRVSDVALMGGKREGAAAPRPAAKPAAAGSGFDDMDDGIPF
jgi:single-strand DNA-binding protein